MHPATLKTELPPSNQLLKMVFKSSTAILLAGIAVASASAQGFNLNSRDSTKGFSTKDSKWREPGSQRRAIEGGGNTRNSGRNSDAGESQPSPAEQARQQRYATACVEYDEGFAAYSKGDWSTAVARFQSAAQNAPNEPVIGKSLGEAQKQLKAQEETQRAAQRDKATAAHMQQAINSFAETLRACLRSHEC